MAVPSPLWVLAALLLLPSCLAQNATSGFVEDPPICEDGGSVRGYFFPALPDEHELPDVLRGVMYLLGLFYAFAGVAIIADIFMASIEKITSAERVIQIEDQFFHVQVWNGTVANLTLMALGSSAPEIILSTLEIVTNDFFAGDLGPSTIVGSAAFNLLVISAVCVMVIPDGETRRIEVGELSERRLCRHVLPSRDSCSGLTCALSYFFPFFFVAFSRR
mmetsp:Transcript_9834/g.37077  ORF Transcript_9834/g.37077 Transcript_9834/m.37077 type:complete len:219 (-) Transcript_9834:1945-2601(-)